MEDSVRRSLALTCCISVLAGCANRGHGDALGNRGAFVDSENMRRVLGQASTDAPLLPEPGDIWADLRSPQQAVHQALPTGTVAVAAAPTMKGTFAVQLTAAHSADAAHTEWQHLTHRMPELMSRRIPAVLQADVDSHQIWRLRTGGFTTFAAAAAFCDRVQSKDGQCWVVASAS